MFTLAFKQRQNVSALLVLSMLFSLWAAVGPVSVAHAGIFGTVGKVAKGIFVNVGAVATGVLGAAVGAAVGGGPLGMAAGGIGGFIVGKKVLNWTTSSVANFATVAGAIAGGALCLGMGFPMLAVGVIGGGLIARLAVKAAGKLFGKKTPMIAESQINPEAAAAESAACASFLDKLNKDNDAPATAAVTTKPAAPAATSQTTVKDSQAAYEKYTAAYKRYMEATQKGDAAMAQTAYKEYKEYLGLYNSFIKSGK
ncbi:MAG: hypothetical protein Kow0029_25910 [Candidatus Rifleibacteriota bacterium]